MANANQSGRNGRNEATPETNHRSAESSSRFDRGYSETRRYGFSDADDAQNYSRAQSGNYRAQTPDDDWRDGPPGAFGREDRDYSWADQNRDSYRAGDMRDDRAGREGPSDSYGREFGSGYRSGYGQYRRGSGERDDGRTWRGGGQSRSEPSRGYGYRDQDMDWNRNPMARKRPGVNFDAEFGNYPRSDRYDMDMPDMARSGRDERRWGEQPDYGDRYEQQFRQQSGGRDASRSGSGRGFDRDYLNWRDEQIRKLDDDYEAYRSERQTKFNTDFDSWRSRRASSQEASADRDTSQSSETERGGRAAGKTSQKPAH